MEDRLSATRRGGLAVAALGFIVAVTVGWWGFALAPLPAAPAWVERARYVCFGSLPSGLPDAGGWLLLIGQPVGMVIVLLAVWGEELRAGLHRMSARGMGQALIGAVVVVVVAGTVLTGARLADGGEAFDPGSLERMGSLAPEHRAMPAVRLVDQDGDTISLARFLGRPVLVTFAFAHCQTVCPTVIQEVLGVQAAAAPRPVIVAMTLDPWRDPPERLSAIAESWHMGSDAYLLGGDVPAVERALDAWGVKRSRSETTGDIQHAALVHVIDPAGFLAFTVPGHRSAVERALRELPRH